MVNIGIMGECMVELFDQGDGQYQRTFGGDSLNTAIYLARCTHQVTVHYTTLLGDDALSADMLQRWQAEGILTDTVEQIPNTVPGLYMIQTDSNGERSFLYWRNEAPAKKLFQSAKTPSLIAKLLGFDWLYFTGITLAILEPAGREQLFTLLDRFRTQGGKVAFDGNYRPRLWQNEDAQQLMSKAYQHCDLVLPSVDDEALLWQDDANNTDSILTRLQQFGCQEIVLKRGRDDCLVSSEGVINRFPVPVLSKAVDTTAAGDSFNGGYLAARIAGQSIRDAVQLGQKVAAQVVSQKGAIVPIQL